MQEELFSFENQMENKLKGLGKAEVNELIHQWGYIYRNTQKGIPHKLAEFFKKDSLPFANPILLNLQHSSGLWNIIWINSVFETEVLT